jgi:type IV fimbrial biogenesis protein FimT
MAGGQSVQLLGYPAGWLLMYRNPHSGFSLIELAIVIALIGILASLALPAFSTFIASGRVRTAAEGMLNGLQIARAEAVRRNTTIDLQIGADRISWDVVLPGATQNPDGTWTPAALQTRSTEGATTITGTGRPAMPAGLISVTFNGMGRLSKVNGADPPAPPNAFAIRFDSAVSGARAICVVMLANTPRLCDPLRADATDPQACYFAGGPQITDCL